MRRTDRVRRILLAALVALVAACGSDGEPDRAPATGPANRGITPIPRDASADAFFEAFDLSGVAGRKIHHVEPIFWTALTGRSNADAHVDARTVEFEARQRGMDLSLSLAVVRGEGKIDLMLPPGFGGDASFADPDVRSAYVREVEWLAGNLRPTELALAVELEAYYLERNDDYANFVSLARRAYDTVKRVSPDTQVYVYFLYEELFRSFPGGEETLFTNLRAMLEPFGDKLDLIGLSSYPGLLRSFYPDVDALPANYYSRIGGLVDRPVFFPEVGYPAESSLIIPSSEGQQAAFVSRFFELTSNLPVRARFWSFLHDPEPSTLPDLGPAEEIFFGSSGLRRRDGSPKPAWDAWLAGGSADG